MFLYVNRIKPAFYILHLTFYILRLTSNILHFTLKHFTSEVFSYTLSNIHLDQKPRIHFRVPIIYEF